MSSWLYFLLHNASHIFSGRRCGVVDACRPSFNSKPQCWLQSVVWRGLAPYMQRFSVFPFYYIQSRIQQLCVDKRSLSCWPSPHPCLNVWAFSRTPFSYLIVILSAVTNEPVYLWNDPNRCFGAFHPFHSVLLPFMDLEHMTWFNILRLHSEQVQQNAGPPIYFNDSSPFWWWRCWYQGVPGKKMPPDVTLWRPVK